MEIYIIYLSQPLEGKKTITLKLLYLHHWNVYCCRVLCFVTVSATRHYKKYVVFTLCVLRTVFFHRGGYFSTGLQLLLVSFAPGMHGFKE